METTAITADTDILSVADETAEYLAQEQTLEELSQAALFHFEQAEQFSAKARELDAQLKECKSTAVQHAFESGKYLVAIKVKLPHGEFGNWLADNFGKSSRTARRYMERYNQFAQNGQKRTMSDMNKTANDSEMAIVDTTAVPTSKVLEVVTIEEVATLRDKLSRLEMQLAQEQSAKLEMQEQLAQASKENAELKKQLAAAKAKIAEITSADNKPPLVAQEQNNAPVIPYEQAAIKISEATNKSFNENAIRKRAERDEKKGITSRGRYTDKNGKTKYGATLHWIDNFISQEKSPAYDAEPNLFENKSEVIILEN